MSTEHDGCACGHERPSTDTNLPIASPVVVTDTPAERDGCCGGGGHSRGGGCCGGHAA